ncbi:tRNA/tmRNA/rRNA uracil-C5-methylase (TrmA/RlmC/RlmD family) [Kribbella orskensis]|uniref:tRNA/tmRNA/rRNA uracil-C5-methylase (TrmA/RlmC/RlmD family) n=1 Tax=Kribbella orskensis TaxID=2512216 RepID=A0ABY2B886_9ACTN|nr:MULTISPECIES: TRAM domain-containing protein [Kribbella]TCN31053.1 tRNA/tmRNA/rRNA uracil-C5-methylase (TrmA/RlmC/RlmD family) [Kribbella sp. VKM Ac-2500]TCO11588.1 tRNA/tmRNA/rRNA uracil-C5-methylase (TrmA/RlmC/RlmD family) [Kribbella orskensis]
MTAEEIVGTLLELEVGPVAHGGHCVARYEGQVVFVRHALPGELVHARVTEQNAKYLRADAVQILTPSPHRIEPPCPYAGPGRCGGCDFQHANIVEQRRLKATVVSDTLRRIGGIERNVVMESPGDDGLGWRTRMRYAVVGGRPGMFAHRSHDLVPIDRCLIAHPDTPPVLDQRWPGASSVQAVVSSEGKTAVLTDENSAGRVVEVVRDRRFRVEASGFWQVHPAAPSMLVDAVLAGLEPVAGETALDLYSGVGLFAAFLAEAGCAVLAVEGDRDAVKNARRNLHDLPAVTLEQGDVDKVLNNAAGQGLESVDLVVLDPPRTGAGKAVVRRIAALSPRKIAYVACDPAALARDLKTFGELGYGISSLRAFDLFGMTHHIECVAVLEPRPD